MKKKNRKDKGYTKKEYGVYTPRKVCVCTKAIYVSEDDANKGIVWLVLRRAEEALHIYQCTASGETVWHIGHIQSKSYYDDDGSDVNDKEKERAENSTRYVTMEEGN